jgi:MinD superfamily P-loop ATPase
MREIVVTSGKGGTGKTSLVASLATLTPDLVLADCDVDAADLHLIMNPHIERTVPFQSGHQAVIRPADCTGCGLCETYCRFDAVRAPAALTVSAASPAASPATSPAASPAQAFRVDPIACEGCGVCVHFCPQNAIDFPLQTCGEWYVSETRFGPMVHARLNIAAENSGKLVTLVRKEAQRIAKNNHKQTVLVDGSPGIGCPVIASITGASLVLVVTEPSLSGKHDLKRLVELIDHFEIPGALCINKWDIDETLTQSIERMATEHKVPVVGRIRYDRTVTTAQVAGKAVVDYPQSPAAKDIRQVWKTLQATYF